jgi:von Willebrand factor type A domain
MREVQKMKGTRNGLPAVLAAAVIVAAIALPNGAAAAVSRAHASAGCTPATNIEAIIDDSSSMAGTDANTLRVKGLKLLIKTLGSSTFLGAVEFGGSLFGSTPSADTVFKPEPVGPNAATMEAALNSKIKADNGTTDYNAAFAQSDADNPNAQVRIFLTDGGHNVGTYNNGHLTHKVATHVIAFSPGVADTEAQNRLRTIASDTGGQFYALSDSSQLQAVMNSIGAALTCQTLAVTFNDVLAAGASKVHTVSIGGNTKVIQIALTWVSPTDKFSIANLSLIDHGRTVARRSSRVRKLKVKTSTSPTFTVLKVSGLSRGKLSFKVKATAIGSGASKVALTTQVSEGR